jgi:indolepyruvate ferredoxin oxidoreductase
MNLAPVSLDDKYTQVSGQVYLTAMQALVRLPFMQRQRDLAAGFDTAGFISGYRGSPLGGYDSALWNARDHLKSQNVVFQPGVNEELAGTAVWGSQQANAFPGAKHDGVFGIWYGKGPGVDRCGDVFKHANFAGTSPHGGVLALAGDDHGAKSSTVAHQSDQAFIAAMMPILNPAGVQDILDFGIYGWELSRFSGCWVGMKLVAETAECTATVDVGPGRINIVTPNDVAMPEGGLNIRPVDGLAEPEARVVQYKLPAVEAFVRANQIDKTVIDGPKARLGIASAGKSYMDVRQALDELGIGDREAAELGLRVYKIGMSWPLEPAGAARFADGLDEILVVEEKRPIIENQFAQLLYNLDGAARPRLVGKRDKDGTLLLPEHGELDPGMVALAIGERLVTLGAPGLEDRVEAVRRRVEEIAARPMTALQRTPYFCSGCPHNTSTRVPDGSVALAGIGCHAMAAFRPERNTRLFTQMGGEGANWIGQAPFTDTGHVFQNLGDGTYYHSGLMAIRAAVAAGVNMTYKVLYNDAVAMTGGQPLDGPLSVGDITRQVDSEGATKVVVVSDDPGRHGADAGLAAGVTVHHRDDLDKIQRELRETPGVTVLVYEQTCAAEKRRRRKRNLFPDPPKRIVINDLVCEGCGDCNLVSNCVSVKPAETEFGRKRRIDQSSCNKDYSCVKGFCPSLVTVQGGDVRKPKPADIGPSQSLFDDLPEPSLAPMNGPYNVMVTGIGGTGVVTVGALLGMAAHLEGKATTILDQTGLAQKNGAVISHVRLAADSAQIHGTRIAAGNADLVIGCDMVVAAGVDALSRIGGGRTRAAINGHVEPTASFIFEPDIALGAAPLRDAISSAVGEGRAQFIDATPIATALMGDSIATNPFMVGYACQMGALPVSQAAILRAIEINGIAVESNKQAFQWGRLAAHDPNKMTEIIASLQAVEPEPLAVSLDDVVAKRVAFLTDYQNTAYAERYRALVEKVTTAEAASVPGSQALTMAVARNAFKLMAYKDEYEVARLFSDGRFEEKVRGQFDGDIKFRFNLAPPLLASKDPETGHLTKREYGPWIMTAFRVLAKFRGLRGTMFDVFGHTEERRTERQLIKDYEARVNQLLEDLNRDTHSIALQIASLPDHIRGFGHVKEAAIDQARAEEQQLVAAFESGEVKSAAAE